MEIHLPSIDLHLSPRLKGSVLSWIKVRQPAAGLADAVESVVRAHSEGKVLGDVEFFQQVKVDIKDG